MRRVLKVLGAVILACVLTAGGYLAGQRAQQDSIVSALPRKTIDRAEPPDTFEPATMQEEAQNTELPESLQPEKNITEKNSVTAIQEGWTQIDKADIMLSPDNSAQVRLYTSAQEDSDGSLIMDDGNTWVLEVEKDGEYYPLINKYVQLGKVNFIAGEDEKGDGVITAVISTGTGVTVEKYTYNGTAFEEQTVYNSGLLNVKGSTF